MYPLYVIVLYLLLPFALLKLIISGRMNPEYSSRWKERFGITPAIKSNRKLIWIHAVSVGEVQASIPLVEYLGKNYPSYQLLITTVTLTGASIVDRLYPDSIEHRFLPYDLPVSISRFIEIIKPHFLIILETEIWPILYKTCSKNNIPIALINARLSEKSLRGYKILSNLTKKTLEYVSVIATQTKTDAERFISLKVQSEKISVTGNLKYDIHLDENLFQEAKIFKQRVSNRPVLIAASTHEGEEAIILSAYADVLRAVPDCLLVIAPRHPHRTNDIEKKCLLNNYKTIRYSRYLDSFEGINIYILDTLGQLSSHYAASDIAFVGGSLVPAGGHNLIEPAMLGVPIITGTHLSNFVEVAKMLDDDEALVKVKNSTELSQAVIALFNNPELREQMGKKGKSVVKSKQGSINKIAKLLDRYLC